MKDDGSDLIFLISQPRAGSTLLQRIIGGHPAVHTAQEPTFMLHPLYAMKREGVTAEFHAGGARLFTREFLATLPRGEREYDEAVRRLALYLYGQAMAGRKERYFLDKTPRYYFIIPDLARVFPAARFVILLRHPLGVLNSIWTTWIKADWPALHLARHDLLTAPGRLADGITALGERAYLTRYESIVQAPEVMLPPLFDWLGVDFKPSLIEYGQAALPRWEWGDQKRVYRERRPVSDGVAAWRKALAEPQFWRLAADYSETLGPATWHRLGYDAKAVASALYAARPAAWRRAATVSLDWLLARPPAERTLAERARLKLARLANGGR